MNSERGFNSLQRDLGMLANDNSDTQTLIGNALWLIWCCCAFALKVVAVRSAQGQATINYGKLAGVLTSEFRSIDIARRALEKSTCLRNTIREFFQGATVLSSLEIQLILLCPRRSQKKRVLRTPALLDSIRL